MRVETKQCVAQVSKCARVILLASSTFLTSMLSFSAVRLLTNARTGTSLWHAVLALPRQQLPGLRVASFLPLAVRVPQVFCVGLLLVLLVDLPLLLPR